MCVFSLSLFVSVFLFLCLFLCAFFSAGEATVDDCPEGSSAFYEHVPIVYTWVNGSDPAYQVHAYYTVLYPGPGAAGAAGAAGAGAVPCHATAT